jgi:hypothetical protein
MVTSGKNKRKYPRAIFCKEVHAITKSGNFKCLTMNLTPDGMLIKTRESLAMEDDISLFIDLPDSQEPARIDGKVVRVVGDAFGIKFSSPMASLLAT